MPHPDQLYAQKQSQISDFVFDEKVAVCFEDMINRSVPGYQTIIHMIGILAGQYVTKPSNCYDLGCSLGASTLAMRQCIQAPNCHIIAVDSSNAMIQKCRQNINVQESAVTAEYVCADIQDIEIKNAAMVVLNFTLQFIDPQKREELLKKIFKGIQTGGILVVSDKISFLDPKEQEVQTRLHHTFKKLQGYSDLQIAQKRTALENVLIPDTLQTHQARLKKIGFQSSSVWFQCFNFASMIAFK